MNTINYQIPGTLELTKHEKIHNIVFDNSIDGSKAVALEIALLIKEKQLEHKSCVLGLATGSSPIKVYDELVRLHKEKGLSFENVISFNLDEYYGLPKERLQSYYYFMHHHLFDHIDIMQNNIHIPDGMVTDGDAISHCLDYEQKIKDAGGIDFQLLGIGRSGHIGFNEPGSHINSATRLITLDYITKVDASGDFNGINNVPKKAITMGVASILKSRRIVLMAWGQNKASIVKRTIEGEVTSEVPASFLQNHDNVSFVLDKAASRELTRTQTPWLVGDCDWTEDLKNKAIIWLCQEKNQSVLKLTDRDYSTNGMADLLTSSATAYDLNIKLFNKLQHTITGWPGGKPNTDDSQRPERAFPEKKRVLIFSPHPDDDVISMGGTLLKLIKQGHEVHVVYQTSGNIAVTDDEALKFAEVCNDFCKEKNETTLFEEVIDFLKNETKNPVDSVAVRKLKGLIRRRESYGAVRYLGLRDNNVHFLDLPFYETGKVKKKPMREIDVALVAAIIEQIQPHQIFAAGDLADPHGTHEVCLNAVFEALKNLKQHDYMKDCWLWLYRGAWHEWDIHDIDMAVPLSPDEVFMKKSSILYHQSQKDKVMFQGNDPREFWLRAEERNKNTAKLYNDIGLADYQAIEAFKRYYF